MIWNDGPGKVEKLRIEVDGSGKRSVGECWALTLPKRGLGLSPNRVSPFSAKRSRKALLRSRLQSRNLGKKKGRRPKPTPSRMMIT